MLIDISVLICTDPAGLTWLSHIHLPFMRVLRLTRLSIGEQLAPDDAYLSCEYPPPCVPGFFDRDSMLIIDQTMTFDVGCDELICEAATDCL